MEDVSNDKDCERSPQRPRQSRGGYDRLAKFMGDVPDVAIFRRFANLSAESILHYQAELYELEIELRKIQESDRDAKKDPEQNTFSFNSRNLRDSARGGENSRQDNTKVDSAQWTTICRIRDVLKDYYSALAQHQQIVNFKKPHHGQWIALKEYMERPSMGNIYFTGEDDDIWTESKLHELITMEPTTADGTTSSRATVTLLGLYHRVLGRYIHKQESSEHLRNTILYHDSGVFKVVRMSKALAASLLPIVSVVILYAVKEIKARIGVLAGLTAAFSLILCYFTSASIKDVFSATAAFSAVLVVFIGSTE